jgi:DNA polymerase III delta prime subunit
VTQSTLSAQEKADMVSMLADVEYRIHSGADPEIQISALLAKISMLSADKRKKQSSG